MTSSAISSASPDPYPGLPHMLCHLTGHTQRLVLPYLLTGLTHEAIAEALGPGWTRRSVESGSLRVRDLLGTMPDREHLARIRLLRRAVGIEECFCGWSPTR